MSAGAALVLDAATDMVSRLPVPDDREARDHSYQAAVIAALELDQYIARLRKGGDQ